MIIILDGNPSNESSLSSTIFPIKECNFLAISTICTITLSRRFFKLLPVMTLKIGLMLICLRKAIKPVESSMSKMVEI